MDEHKPIRKIVHDIDPTSTATFVVGKVYNIPTDNGIMRFELVSIVYNNEYAKQHNESRYDINVAFGGEVQLWKSVFPNRVVEYNLFA